MDKVTNGVRVVITSAVIIYSVNVYPYEASLVADVDARVEYNDNIFITNQPHEGVTGLLVTPSITGVVKEKHWQAALDARLRNSTYTDSSLDGNDQYFNLNGSYNAERNIYSLNVNYDLDSNLSSTSTDFGLSGKRINRKMRSISPQYTRFLSERVSLTLSYSYSDVEYLDAADTGYLPYATQAGSGSIIYNLSERSQINASLQVADYASKDNLTTYLLFSPRFGITHRPTETVSLDFMVGASRRTTTNLNTETIPLLGTVLTRQT